MKIWIDTDIGSEIDDALALAFLVSNPGVEVLGISTVSDQAKTRAMLASAICRAVGRFDISIYVGSDKTLNGESFGQSVPQAVALDYLDHQVEFEKCDVPNRLRETIEKHCGEVTLLTIGPLSNVAKLFAIDPNISARLRFLVTMCGNFSSYLGDMKASVEWNAKLDPESARQVFRTPVLGGHYLLGLETTRNFSIASTVLEQSESSILQAILKLHRARAGVEKPLTMYDLAAAVLAVRPDLGRTQRGTASVDREAERGATSWRVGQTGNHLRFKTIARDKIVHEFFSLLKIHQEFHECESALLA